MPEQAAPSGATAADQAYSDGYRTGFMHGGGGRMACPVAKDGDADELLLVRDDERVGGRVTIGHTRLPVVAVLQLLDGGTPFGAVRASYPSVDDGQLRVLSALQGSPGLEPVSWTPDDPMPVELAVSVLQNATLTDRETHALRSLAAVLDRDRPGQHDVGPPEPRWVACAGCVGRVDRHEPHVAETFALEVLRGRHEIKTQAARPARRWHQQCAPAHAEVQP